MINLILVDSIHVYIFPKTLKESYNNDKDNDYSNSLSAQKYSIYTPTKNVSM